MPQSQGEQNLVGTFHYTVAVGSKDSSNSEMIDALVDTGSTYTVMPAPLLEKLGIASEWTSVFELADGRREEYPLAEIRVKVNGEERTTICIFGPPESEPLLGAYTLEGFGLAADPVNRRLVPARLFLA
jgi:clan AA aspartic protease